MGYWSHVGAACDHGSRNDSGLVGSGGGCQLAWAKASQSCASNSGSTLEAKPSRSLGERGNNRFQLHRSQNQPVQLSEAVKTSRRSCPQCIGLLTAEEWGPLV